MLLALTIIMSASLASRMFFTLAKESADGELIKAFSTFVIDGGLYQTILGILYAHT